MIVGQLAHLLGGGAHQPFLAEADRHAPQARQPLDVFLALIVVDVDAFAALDDHRADLLVAPGVGRGVEMIGDVPGGGGVRISGH